MCRYSVKTHLTDLQAAKYGNQNGQALRSLLLSRLLNVLEQFEIYFVDFEWHSYWLMSQRSLDCEERVRGRAHEGISSIEMKVYFAKIIGQKKWTEGNPDFSLEKTAGTKLRIQYDSNTYAAGDLVVAESVKTRPVSLELFNFP